MQRLSIRSVAVHTILHGASCFRTSALYSAMLAAQGVPSAYFTGVFPARLSPLCNLPVPPFDFISLECQLREALRCRYERHNAHRYSPCYPVFLFQHQLLISFVPSYSTTPPGTFLAVKLPSYTAPNSKFSNVTFSWQRAGSPATRTVSSSAPTSCST